MPGSSTLPVPQLIERPRQSLSARSVWLLFAALFTAIYFASLWTPPLLDDVDAAHAQAAQYIADTGDWITPHIDGIRYIEKPPLPYWIVAGLYKITGVENAFTTHLPNALAMLALTWLCWAWARRAWGERAGLYAGLAVLTSVGPFLFTRFIIPESLLAFFLLAALYALITSLELNRPLRAYWMWACVALALLTKGLIAPVFFFRRGHSLPAAHRPMAALEGAQARYGSALSGHRRALAHSLRPGQSRPGPRCRQPSHARQRPRLLLLLLRQRAPAPLLQPALSARLQQDACALVLGARTWSGCFPWSLFLPAVVAVAWKTRHNWMQHLRQDAGQTVDFYLDHALREDVASYVVRLKFRVRTVWLLSLFSAWTLLFFSVSTNQEYYTFPVWPALFILIAGVVAEIEQRRSVDSSAPVLSTAWLTGAQAVFALIGIASAATLGWGLWDSRHLPYVADIGTLLAHRDVADYTLSMSHVFDLTGPAFAALRLPAILAALALLIGPAAGWLLRIKRRHRLPPSALRSPWQCSLLPRTSLWRALSPCSAPSNWPT